MSQFVEHSAQKFGHALGLENDVEGLRWINDFGWLRSLELGMLVWPDAKAPRKYGERLTRKWLKRSLVLRRQLPYGAGTAYVLSPDGAALLRECGISAETGKNWGRSADGEWSAPGSWRHDLLVAGMLAHLHRLGLTVLPETRIRRENPDMVKIPDALAIDNGKAFWIEVERARKTGDRMDDLIQLIIALNEGRVQRVSGYEVTSCIIGFDPQALDEKGHAISHSLRIRRALAERSTFDVSAVSFLQLALQGLAVANLIQEEPFFVESLEVSRLVEELQFRTMLNRSSTSAEYKVSRMNEYVFRYQQAAGSSGSAGWEWAMGYLGKAEEEAGKVRTLRRGTATSEARCQRTLAMAYLARFQFYPYDLDIDSM